MGGYPKHDHEFVPWEGHPGHMHCRGCGWSFKIQNEEERQVERRAVIAAASIGAILTIPRDKFSNRGLSDRTIDALIAHGVDAPERLLFAAEADLKRIPGVGKVAFDEIMRYRAQFIPELQPHTDKGSALERDGFRKVGIEGSITRGRGEMEIIRRGFVDFEGLRRPRAARE